ncbi:MAG: GntR family transcriptional regulator [Acidimicrobiales bacterium]
MGTGSYTVPALRRQRVHLELKRRLLRGELPMMVRLAEERLADELGVSRTPVREALVQLAAESLVERLPDGGFCPAVPDLVAVAELYEVRASLELDALGRPGRRGQRHEPSALEPLRDEWRALARELPEPDPSFVERDESFHMALAAAAGNATLVRMLETVNERIRVVRMHDFLTPDRVRLTVAEHLAIVEALLAAKADLAGARLLSHIMVSNEVVMERATRGLARMAGRAPLGLA